MQTPFACGQGSSLTASPRHRLGWRLLGVPHGALWHLRCDVGATQALVRSKSKLDMSRLGRRSWRWRIVKTNNLATIAPHDYSPPSRSVNWFTIRRRERCSFHEGEQSYLQRMSKHYDEICVEVIMRTISILLVLLISGCATNGYAKFYTSATGVTPEVIASNRSGPQPAVPEVARAAEFDGLVDAYARKGYAAVGISSFSSGRNERDGDAIEQGKRIGADLVVVINPEYVGSQTTAIPITIPTTTTSQTSGTATAYGTGGTATAYGNSTTTTYGSRTTYVPMTVNRYEFGALYFVKRRYLLGANYRDLSDEERRQLQSNRGAYVISVIDDSPAYESDILPGDVIVALNGQAANGQDGLSDLVKASEGRAVELTIIRQGMRLTKSVALLKF